MAAAPSCSERDCCCSAGGCDESPAGQLGWRAAAFDLPDPDGRRHTLAGCMGEKGLLVAFICNHCPYVVAVADRLAADARELQSQGVGAVAVMSNDYRDYPDDSPPKMKQFAARHDFSFPYLVDEDQSAARAWGAVCTPDFFGLNRDGLLQYRGRLDDVRPDADPSVRTPELLDAMTQVAETGAGPETQRASMGCSIKWKK